MFTSGRTVYFKRYRMELILTGRLEVPKLPPEYWWRAWHPSLLQAHALTKFRSFRNEMDSLIFPNLGDLRGCTCLMHDITLRMGFCPEATWLVEAEDGWCGTIQGIRDRSRVGMIQNLGVVPEHRGRGLGTALLLKAIEGFRNVGARRVLLEVTADNESAVRIYRRIGFRCRKTLYKPVVAPPPGKTTENTRDKEAATTQRSPGTPASSFLG